MLVSWAHPSITVGRQFRAQYRAHRVNVFFEFLFLYWFVFFYHGKGKGKGSWLLSSAWPRCMQWRWISLHLLVSRATCVEWNWGLSGSSSSQLHQEPVWNHAAEVLSSKSCLLNTNDSGQVGSHLFLVYIHCMTHTTSFCLSEVAARFPMRANCCIDKFVETTVTNSVHMWCGIQATERRHYSHVVAN